MHWIYHWPTGTKRYCSELAFAILSAAGSWTTLTRLREAVRNTPGDFDAVVLELMDAQLLQPSDRAPSQSERAFEQWDGWSPSAAFFHSVSRQMRPAVTELDRYRGQPLMSKRVFPSPLKQYPDLPRTALPQPRAVPIRSTLGRRRTWREFGGAPLGLDDLATLLGLTFGVQQWLEVGDEQWVALKSSPSGGARHSIEAYVIAVCVDGLQPGTYHYCPDSHALAPLQQSQSRDFARSLVPTQPGFHDAGALVVLTSVFSRMQWKYPHPHAYRVVLMDAGHLSQTFALVATELNLAPFCTAALDFDRLERHLQIDGVSESGILLLGVGSKPGAKEWSPMHDRAAALPRTQPPTRSVWNDNGSRQRDPSVG